MAQTLESFAQACHDILKADPGPDGRKKVCALVEDALKDPEFVRSALPDTLPERKVLYEDPELGFCILGHLYKGAKQSAPHDHGPSWAIYGQAEGRTMMDDWELLEPAAPDRPGKVRHVRAYALTPGMAYVYNEGELHSPRRDDTTKLLRIEGMNMDRVKRLSYQAV